MVFAVYDLADCTSGADAYLYFEVRIPPPISSLKEAFLAPSEIGMHSEPGGQHSKRCSGAAGKVLSIVL
jgi:hypothetical protein